MWCWTAENPNLVNSEGDCMAERGRVARLEVDSSAPDSRPEGPAAGWHGGCNMMVRSAGSRTTETQSRGRERARERLAEKERINFKNNLSRGDVSVFLSVHACGNYITLHVI